MEAEKIGQLIKEIRKNNHLTQNQFAQKYGVTYQAVSKWENGKNMPDITLLKQISKDYQINLDDILEGKITEKKQKPNKQINLKICLILSSIIILIITTSYIIILNHNKQIQLKSLSTSNDLFNISGSIAYNDSLSSIYISKIKYRDQDDRKIYQKIECILYETNGTATTQISRCDYNGDSPIPLEKFFETITLQVDNYKRTCKKYSHNSLFIQINATDENETITSYKVPLSINDNCKS